MSWIQILSGSMLSIPLIRWCVQPYALLYINFRIWSKPITVKLQLGGRSFCTVRSSARYSWNQRLWSHIFDIFRCQRVFDIDRGFDWFLGYENRIHDVHNDIELWISKRFENFVFWFCTLLIEAFPIFSFLLVALLEAFLFSVCRVMKNGFSTMTPTVLLI